MYLNLNNESQQNTFNEKTIVSYGRICNMLGETSKELGTSENTIKFYLKGIAYEPNFIENFIDFAQLCFS